MNPEIVDTMVRAAMQVMDNAYVPYGKAAIGACVLASDGTFYTGCNIENAAYGPSNCAERTAIFKAVSEGVRDFEAIAIVGGPEDQAGQVQIQDFCPPCGVCRQVMAEFCGKDLIILLVRTPEDRREYTLEEIFPLAFRIEETEGRPSGKEAP